MSNVVFSLTNSLKFSVPEVRTVALGKYEKLPAAASGMKVIFPPWLGADTMV